MAKKGVQKMDKGTLEFRVDTLALLHEIADAAMDRKMGVLKIPLNILRNHLAQLAAYAVELNDPKLHIIMLNMGLYEVPAKEIPSKIKALKEIINNTIENGKD